VSQNKTAIFFYLFVKVLSRNSHVGTEENHEHSRDNRAPSRDLKPGPPEYSAGVLTTRPRRSVIVLLPYVVNSKSVSVARRRNCTL
jgi:hypothetical protein